MKNIKKTEHPEKKIEQEMVDLAIAENAEYELKEADIEGVSGGAFGNLNGIYLY